MVAEQKRKRNTGKFDKQGVAKYTKDNTLKLDLYKQLT